MPERRHIEDANTPADKLVFGEISDGVDYEYSVNGSGVKENIIIKKKAEDYRYSFELTCTNVAAEYDESRKRVIFCELEDNTEIFSIPAPFMTDANGALSTAVSYEMTPLNDGKSTLTVVADENWINAKERVFPVTIDPQITIDEMEVFKTYRYEDGLISETGVNIVGTYITNGIR